MCYKYLVKKIIPQIIKEVGFDFRWNEESVWGLEAPAELMDISELAWHFDVPFWKIGDKYYALTPNQMLESPEKYQAELKRTLAADTRHPIDIMWNKDRWVILDGLHRLVKQVKGGKKTVMVRKVDRKYIPQITK